SAGQGLGIGFSSDKNKVPGTPRTPPEEERREEEGKKKKERHKVKR
ncbi:unnamed protein product, partial [marine sediment metagenome]